MDGAKCEADARESVSFMPRYYNLRRCPSTVSVALIIAVERRRDWSFRSFAGKAIEDYQAMCKCIGASVEILFASVNGTHSCNRGIGKRRNGME